MKTTSELLKDLLTLGKENINRINEMNETNDELNKNMLFVDYQNALIEIYNLGYKDGKEETHLEVFSKINTN